MDQIGAVFAFYDTEVLKSCNGIISNFERPPLNAGKPALETGEIQRILFARVNHDNGTWGLELSASALSKNRDRRAFYWFRSHVPCQRRSNQCMPFSQCRSPCCLPYMLDRKAR